MRNFTGAFLKYVPNLTENSQTLFEFHGNFTAPFGCFIESI